MSPLRLTVAVQGEPGSNSALAAEQYLGKERVALMPCSTFADLFAVMARGDADLAMAPVENSLGGSVHPVWDLLTRSDCAVVGEMFFHVRHCLIAHPSVALHEIRSVYSHEQALAQCRRFLGQLVWLETDHIISAYDTAGAVKMIKARGLRSEAAIASPQAAGIYSMSILATDIQTDPANHTRFLLLTGRNEPHATAADGSETWWRPAHADALAASGLAKYTLIMVLDNCGRQLPGILATLHRESFRLVKLETAKLVGRPWVYRVYLDFVTGCEETIHAEIGTRLQGMAETVRLLGPYPAAPCPDAAKPG